MMIGKLDGTLDKVNPATLEIMGYTEEELVTMPVIDWVHPDDREMTLQEHREVGFPEHLCLIWEDALERVFTTGKSYSTFFDTVNANGPVRIQWNAFPGLVTKGEVQSVFTVSRDITQYMKNTKVFPVWSRQRKHFTAPPI